ncbi:MAG TPA: glycoside hydrolase family 3 N-terminal domain-containing protein [Candidatus Acidoferrum sp.]|nr:glycoside hydrolase family 3 N-terminal domain-containing protein [Candidatus Acidoferrum sp.]
MSREKGRRVIAVASIGTVIAGVMLIARPISAWEPTVAVPSLPSFSPIPASDSVPDLGSLQEDVGSVLAVSWRGTGISPQLSDLLDGGRVGSVLLFAPNFGSPAGLKALTDSLQALASTACLDHPILVMLDEEGGQVARVQADFTPASELVVGGGGPDHVRAVERTSGSGLHQLGVGLNLAPVADVRTNPRDAIILDRSFGSNAAQVAPLVGAAVQGLHDGGVGATLKHFPGLGGAPGDPHVSIPTDPESEARWESVQMPAFAAGIAAGADAVMTTAVYVPGLGGGTTPAMFSAPVVGRLRSQLGFGGVIISDSVSMGGISDRYSLPEATVLALAAGNDMVLLGNGDPAYEAEAFAAVRAAVLSGRLDRAALHVSALRVNRLRDRWGRRFTHCRPVWGA